MAHDYSEVNTCDGQTVALLLLVTALNASLLEQLAVLLLRHPLAALLDDRTHEEPSS
jgi:hypothetical protein